MNTILGIKKLVLGLKQQIINWALNVPTEQKKRNLNNMLFLCNIKKKYTRLK